MTPTEAGRALGSIKTEKKSAASAKTLSTFRPARWPNPKPCSCGQADGGHKQPCPGYWRDRRVARRSAA
jgi:hypothetical protein